MLWVLVVGPALARALGGFARDVDYFTYVAIGQIVFVLPFSAMFAGLLVMQDRDFGILRELLVAPIHRSTIPLASIAAVLTIGAGQIVLIIVLALARGAHFHVTLMPLIGGLAAAALLTAGTYGLAEYLAYTLTQPQTFGTLIPAIGATPYALCGAIYPIAALPVGVRQFSLILPWTHADAEAELAEQTTPALEPSREHWRCWRATCPRSGRRTAHRRKTASGCCAR